jgi:co-chaperonin GroES (HSP10)
MPKDRKAMIRNDKELIVVGDRVLVKCEDGEERTKVGLYLPSTALDSQAVQGGTIVATGPGQPMPAFDAHGEEPWKEPAREVRFVPMQARLGDYALFFRKAAVEITFEGDRYLVVPQTAILALVRE